MQERKMLSIRHTGIYVCNLEKMKQFYCDTFGMEVAVHAFEKGSYIETVLGLKEIELEVYKLRFEDGTMLELIHRKGGDEAGNQGRVYDNGHIHIALTVGDVEQRYKKLSQLGTTFISGPMFSADGTAKVCFCRDPEGNYLELVEEISINEKL